MHGIARHFRTSWLRLLFWSCWAAMLAPAAGSIYARSMGRDLTQWFALSPVTIIPLCFLSAECVNREPRLALIGMYSLAIYFLWFFSAH